MILLYHKVDAVSPSQWWVTADAFDRQMADLQSFRVVHLDDYDPEDPQCAVITFDGVYENVFRFAFPILRKWNYPFELFVIGDHIGGDNAFDSVEPPARFCTLEHLAEMSQHRGRVQWHTRTHQRLGSLPKDQLIGEIVPPLGLRERFITPHLRWFAYPHGEHNEGVEDLVKREFSGALSCIAGNDTDRYQLNRETIFPNSRLSRSRVTIIVANYNYGHFLPEALESVFSQSHPPDELIIIDDCSTDGSQEIALRYQDRAKVVINEQNLGIVANFNKAVSLSGGDYIAFLGADNRFRSDYIERCKAALDRDSRCAIAYTDMTIFGPRARELASQANAVEFGNSRTESWPIFLWTFPEATEGALAELGTKNFMHGSSMYRRAAFDEVGGYELSDGPEDHNLFKRMVASGWKCVRVPHALLDYRQHSASQANTVVGLRMETQYWKTIARQANAERAASAQLAERLLREASDLVTTTQSLESKIRTLQEHANKVQQEAHYYQRKFNQVKRSVTWRAGYPFRIIGSLAQGDIRPVKKAIQDVKKGMRKWSQSHLKK